MRLDIVAIAKAVREAAGVRKPAGRTPMRVRRAAVVSAMFSRITWSTGLPSISQGLRRSKLDRFEPFSFSFT